jgi:uncharacterized protein
MQSSSPRSTVAEAFRHVFPSAAAAAFGIGFATIASAGTVYCSAASKPAEFAICNSEDLQVLDGRVAELYKSQHATSASVLSQTALARDHHKWLASRNECRANLGCLEKYYRKRLSALEDSEKSPKEPIAQFTRFAVQANR